MDNCEKLAQVEGFVAERYVQKTANELHLLTELMSQESYMNLRYSDRDFKKLSQDMEEIYKCALIEGFRIEADNFGGYCSVNRSGKIIKKRWNQMWCRLAGKKNQKLVWLITGPL